MAWRNWGLSGWKRLLVGIQTDAQKLIREAFGTAASMGLIWFADYLYQKLIGPDAKFFDFIPVKWVFDAGHVAMMYRFIKRILREEE